MSLNRRLCQMSITALSLLPILLLPDLADGQEVAKSVLDRIRQVSVSIEDDAGNCIGSGTLFVKDNETWCATAQHVVATAKDRNLRVAQHRNNKVVSVYAVLVKQDEKRDVALLKVGSGVFAHGAVFSKVAKAPLDTAVVHCGSMAGHHHTVTRGYLVGHDQVFRPGVLRDLADFTGYYGSSGGGVFSTSGDYLGMVVGGTAARIVYFVPMRNIEDILK